MSHIAGMFGSISSSGQMWAVAVHLHKYLGGIVCICPGEINPLPCSCIISDKQGAFDQQLLIAQCQRHWLLQGVKQPQMLVKNPTRLCISLNSIKLKHSARKNLPWGRFCPTRGKKTLKLLNPYPSKAQQEIEVKEGIWGDAIFVFSGSSTAFCGMLGACCYCCCTAFNSSGWFYPTGEIAHWAEQSISAFPEGAVFL